MNPEQSIDVSIVIPVRDEEDYLPACFDALDKLDTTAQIEIIVVDNGSSDNTKRIAMERSVQVLEESVPGVGRARRVGTGAAHGTYVLHIDADTRLPEMYITEALERFSNNPQLVCVGGQVHWYDASRTANAVRRVLYMFFTPVVRLISRGSLGPMGNNMMFLRSAYEKCSGFDATLKFGEDADLTKKLRKHGKILLDLSLICYTSSRRFSFNKDFLIYCLNTTRICVGLKALKNELPSLKKDSSPTIDK